MTDYWTLAEELEHGRNVNNQVSDALSGLELVKIKKIVRKDQEISDSINRIFSEDEVREKLKKGLKIVKILREFAISFEQQDFRLKDLSSFYVKLAFGVLKQYEVKRSQELLKQLDGAKQTIEHALRNEKLGDEELDLVIELFESVGEVAGGIIASDERALREPGRI